MQEQIEKYYFLRDKTRELFALTESLNQKFRHRKFTPDGRLIGDIGEIMAELFYDIVLDDNQKERHDGIVGGKNVQVKISFQDQLTFGKTPDHYLGLKLYKDGTFEEIYNGPGQIIYNNYQDRKGIGEKLLRFPMKRLSELQMKVDNKDRITPNRLCDLLRHAQPSFASRE